MGNRSAADIDNWLHSGGIVLAASDRAARHLRHAFHQRRSAEGFSAWPEPEIHSYPAFVQNAWLQRALDDRLLLNPAQEQSLWARIASAENSLLTSLEQPLHHIATLAAEAHGLLCTHAPRLLRASARAGWAQNAGAFNGWLAEFDRICSRDRLLSPSRLPLELIPLLQSEPVARPSLLLVGFDRILPTQRDLFHAWGTSQSLALDDSAHDIAYFSALDDASELDACALWCMQSLAQDPAARILVLSQQIAAQRGQIERAFLRVAPPAAHLPFEFSLGIPLSAAPLARAALLLLRWLAGPLSEHEIDWLFSTGLVADPQESDALQARMRNLRSRNLASPQWALHGFLNLHADAAPPASWLARAAAAQKRLSALQHRLQSPLEWASLVPQLLADFGLPHERRLTSPEHQALQRWQQALDICASLAFLGQPLSWPAFLTALARILGETLFAPQSSNAPILIAGPAESAGLTADALWFLGVDQDSWPARASTHPLLPLAVQREFSMPHATAMLDLELARTATTRLLASAPVLRFSLARQHEGAETFPSRLIREHTGNPQPLPGNLLAPPSPAPLAVPFIDKSCIPLAPEHAAALGGASVLTAQSNCPFQAFAVHRLDAQSWEPAQTGLTPAQRGRLLHEVLHSIARNPPPSGIRSLHDLLDHAGNLPAFVEPHVRDAFPAALKKAVLARMPRAYLDVESQRLVRIVSQWLEFESHRLPFTIEQTELSQTVSPAGLQLKVRLDRLDRLADGSLLVIDYKTSAHKPSEWTTPRPEDPQLPLYAVFALPAKEALGGLAFAQLRTGEPAFAGRLHDAASTLNSSLTRAKSLVKNPLTADQISEWRATIEDLARDYLAGRADVDPLDPAKTCERCGLHTLCRIAEREDLFIGDDEDDEKDSDD
ncbi:MAG TPA: PD-(D/E)XK nuclease family protein [Terracidiphilus sp.]|nr:PD-(D/E)XK nuclease family protein [Terracidiphilus sp.]